MLFDNLNDGKTDLTEKALPPSVLGFAIIPLADSRHMAKHSELST